MTDELSHPRFPLTIGIAGGMGPFAHIRFENRLLALAADPSAWPKPR